MFNKFKRLRKSVNKRINIKLNNQLIQLVHVLKDNDTTEYDFSAYDLIKFDTDDKTININDLSVEDTFNVMSLAIEYVLQDDDRTSMSRRVKALYNTKFGKEIILRSAYHKTRQSIIMTEHVIEDIIEYVEWKKRKNSIFHKITFIFISLIILNFYIDSIFNIPNADVLRQSILGTFIVSTPSILSVLFGGLYYNTNLHLIRHASRLTIVYNNKIKLFCRAITDADIDYCKEYNELINEVCVENIQIVETITDSSRLIDLINLIDSAN